MILVQGWIRLRDVAEVERLRAAATAMVKATAAEPGCLDYAFAQDLGEPATLRLTERWADEAALAAHFATPHMAAFNAAIAGAAVVAASVKAYAGDEVRTLIER
ncbi:MAG: antibiotic biosynthesis monooxygenase [Sphingomonadaceae bacterium]|nr:antibiotic biosynthesis monooxygenase [Sphingomonadaceae bacterium]